MRRLLVVLAIVAFAAPAFGQVYGSGTQLGSIVTGKVFPTVVKLKDLGEGWVSLSTGNTQGEMSAYLKLMAASMGGNDGRYYTKGESVVIGGESYLVAYGTKTKQLSMEDFRRPDPPAPEKLTPDTELTLSLINLRTTGSLTDIRPFDLKTVLGESAKTTGILESTLQDAAGAAKRSESQNNLKQLALGVQMYTSDWDGKLPPLDTPEVAKKALSEYVKNQNVFKSPVTGEMYMPNAILSKRKEAHITHPSEMVLYYEAISDEDGNRNVAFLDGHVKRVSSSEWRTLKKASKIP